MGTDRPFESVRQGSAFEISGSGAKRPPRARYCRWLHAGRMASFVRNCRLEFKRRTTGFGRGPPIWAFCGDRLNSRYSLGWMPITKPCFRSSKGARQRLTSSARAPNNPDGPKWGPDVIYSSQLSSSATISRSAFARDARRGANSA